MANPTATVTEYCAVLTRSRLLPPAEVATLHEQWKPDAPPGPADSHVDAFRRFLIARRVLTEYQAAMVQRGHAEGFYVGGYVILDRIGKGQTAGVYKAVHESGQVVALKVLPSSKVKNPHLLGRFEREGRLLTQLAHPNVVRAFQIGSAGGVHFIVMEHLDGETLDEILERRQKLPPAEAVRLAFQALQGLQHLHEKRMIHRDLKPANLMAVPGPGTAADSTLNSTVKLLDIGLGRELFDETTPSTHDLHLTAEGALLGTPDYLAPEQARDARGADIRADIYSLGCVLYHLLAGRPPFVEKNVMATMVKHATEAVPAVTQFNPSVAPGLVAVLNRLLAKEPAGRYPTPGDAAEALKPFLPAGAPGAAPARVLPAFKEWLDTESSMEAPANLPPPPPPPPARPKSKSGPQSGILRSGPPSGVIRTGPPSGVIRTGPQPGAARKSGPQSGIYRGPPSSSGTVRTGDRLVGGMGMGAAASAVPAPPAAGPSLKPPSMPGRPSPLAVAPPPPSLPEIDVELVAVTDTGSVAEFDPLNARVVAAPPPRPLYDLDRRDFIMLALGSGGVLAAIGGGFLAARSMKQKANGELDQERQENQP